jgi:aminoglycoside phosphotransferase (APT) family kinase protein
VTPRLEPELVAAIVAAQFPELGPVRAAYLGEGYDSTAFDVNGHLVFRFPKRPDVERQLFVETRMLPLLAVGTPVPIPSYSFQGVPSTRFPRHFAGYVRLTGVPGIGLTLTQAEFLRLAPVLGDFLSFLHSFPVGTAAQLGVPEYASDVLIGEVRAESLGDLGVVRQVDPDAPEATWRAFLETGIEAGNRGSPKPTFVHGDLAAEHILVDPPTQQVTGVLDWSEISIGDPAIDFAGMLHWGGPGFLNAVLSHYRHPTDAGLRDRARFFAVGRGIGDIVFGLETQRPEYVKAGVRALRLCLRSGE